MKCLSLLCIALICLLETAHAQRYQGDASIGYGIGQGIHTPDNVTFQTTHGYLFNPHWFVGGGIGYLVYQGDWEGESVVSVFLNIKGYFTKNRFSPYLSMDVGSGLQSGGGLYLAPAFGVSWMFTQTVGCFAEVAWQSVKVEPVTINNIMIRVGVNF